MNNEQLITYKMDVAYVGTRFCGFQRQVDPNSIQQHLEKALSVMTRQPTKVFGASRTDSGVHAEAQVAVFRSQAPFHAERWMHSLNAILPRGIGVRGITTVAHGFNPVSAATGKAYRYRIWRGKSPGPFLEDFVWRISPELNEKRFAAEAKYLVGTHDFTSFCNIDCNAKTRIRTIHAVSIEFKGPYVEFWIVGEGFLKQMVRIIVGTLVEIAKGKLDRGVVEILGAKDRTKAGQTAAASGLTLVEVFYGEVPTIASLKEKSASGFSLALPF